MTVRTGDRLEPRIDIGVIRTVKRVTTLRRTGAVKQAHRGWVGLIRVPGEKKPRYCCEFHQKPGAAREHAAKAARALARETGLPVSPEAQRRKPVERPDR